LPAAASGVPEKIPAPLRQALADVQSALSASKDERVSLLKTLCATERFAS
jgi:hypothetical protein